VLEGTDVRIVHTQHDEIIVEARDAIEDQVKVDCDGKSIVNHLRVERFI
jgi:hypothetical protein